MKFTIHLTNEKIWNIQQFVQFLVQNQNQHIVLRIIPEAISLSCTGVYKLLDAFEFKQVDIYTENTLETHDRYNIINPWNNVWFDHQPVIDTALHRWNKSKKFLLFYHRPTASRLGLAAYLNRHYSQQSMIHFTFGTDHDKLQLFEFDKLANYRKESLGDLAEFLPKMPMYQFDNTAVQETMTWYDYNLDDGIKMYPNCLIDLISEAHVLGDTFYPTEKTARPIWMKKPFIIFASRNYLDYLHQMGFQTFCNYWSEEYDGYEGRDRFLKILELIDWLDKCSTQQLVEMYRQMQPILEHNYQLLQTQSYNKTISFIQ
jgi:hypothetical protein